MLPLKCELPQNQKSVKHNSWFVLLNCCYAECELGYSKCELGCRDDIIPKMALYIAETSGTGKGCFLKL